MKVKLTKEEVSFLKKNKRFTSDLNMTVALLWGYWSKADIPLGETLERANQIREHGWEE